MSDNTDNSEITGPTTSSKEPLRYDGNKAKLPGLLAEIWDCCERTGKFRPLIENGAVLSSKGSTIIDSVQNIPFLTGVYDDTRDIYDPCPPSQSASSHFLRPCLGRATTQRSLISFRPH